MITIYAICYNEKLMIPHFLQHWRTRFPGCKIVVYDNESTDGSPDLLRAAGCEVRTYKTNNELNDQAYLDIKNECWKSAKTDWVAIVDMDEHCDICESELRIESDNGATMIIFEGYNMVNVRDDLNIETINHGVRAPSYDKFYIFKRRHFRDVNYKPGCHRSLLSGNIVRSSKVYPCWHYKYINPDYMVARHAMFSKRMSKINRRNGWGVHYDYPEQKIREEFEQVRKEAKLLKS